MYPSDPAVERNLFAIEAKVAVPLICNRRKDSITPNGTDQLRLLPQRKPTTKKKEKRKRKKEKKEREKERKTETWEVNRKQLFVLPSFVLD